jgi:DNA-directed RNA polymerase specialized sigma24 family protein
MDQNDDVNNFPDLFSRLDPDPERANEQFSLLRQKLIEVCRYRKIPDRRVEDVVHETLVRLCSRLGRIKDKNLFYYSLAILRNVILEGWRGPETKEMGFDPTRPEPEAPTKTAHETMEKDEHDRHLRECYDACVTKLPKPDEDLYFKYKDLSFNDRATRDFLAASIGISRPALNVKITRIGQRLRDCIKKCMQKLGLQV